jgi:hypothetical protein
MSKDQMFDYRSNNMKEVSYSFFHHEGVWMFVKYLNLFVTSVQNIGERTATRFGRFTLKTPPSIH